MADLQEIIEDANERTGLRDFLVKAPDHIKRAEIRLQRALRTPEMVKTVTLTFTDGAADLPTDFLEEQEVRNGNCPMFRSEDRTLNRNIYRIEGGQIFASLDAVDMSYYAAIPSLVENGTNWLSESNPELYTAAIVHQALAKAMDERMPEVQNYLLSLVGEENRAAVSRSLRQLPMSLRRF